MKCRMIPSGRPFRNFRIFFSWSTISAGSFKSRSCAPSLKPRPSAPETPVRIPSSTP